MGALAQRQSLFEVLPHEVRLEPRTEAFKWLAGGNDDDNVRGLFAARIIDGGIWQMRFSDANTAFIFKLTFG